MNTKIGDVAELAEGTSLLTRQGIKALGGSNPLVSANTKMYRKGAFFVHGDEASKLLCLREDSKGAAMS